MFKNQEISKLAKKIYKLSLDQDQAATGKIAKKIVDFFSRRGQLIVLIKLVRELERLDLRSKGIKQAKVYTAGPADSLLAKTLINALEINLQPEFIIDPKLIAGLKIETEDELIDGTLSGRLLRLA